MEILVDHKLRVVLSALPLNVLHLIEEALSIQNVVREKQMEQGVWGWQDLPETIDLWSRENGNLVMPRGFMADLVLGLEASGVEFEITDERSFPHPEPMKTPGHPLRAWQPSAVAAMLMVGNGIYKAPAGSGKTVAVLEAIATLNTRSIVLVNTKDILWQWIERAKWWLGEDYPLGQIGDGIFEPSTHLTIAIAQTLHSRFGKLESDGFFDGFGFLCLDECHHATAETYNRIVNRFSCRYRIGVSATPNKTGDFALATNVIGPVFHETKRKDVDALIDPVVFKIPTGFRHKYSGRADYPRVLASLIADNDRNRLIVKTILMQENCHGLVVSKRLEHLKTLAAMLQGAGYEWPTMMLTGEESSEDRKEVVEQITSYPGIVFSTLADEALDIPRLDSLFLVFPQRNPGLITQQAGRVCRVHPEKPDAKVFDFCDTKVGPLDAQWRVRRIQVWQANGYEIVTVRPADILEYEHE